MAGRPDEFPATHRTGLSAMAMTTIRLRPAPTTRLASSRQDGEWTRLSNLIAPCLLASACLLATVSAADAAAKALSAREAGARYGQAAGVAIVCYGLEVVTARVEELRARYRDTDLSEFDAEASKILAAWKETASCRNSHGPNPCKLSQVWSCQEALREIGPQGTAAPGLVEDRLTAPAAP